MTRLSILSFFVAAALLTGCDSMTDMADVTSALANGVASPNTPVSATVQFTQAGEVVIRESGPGNPDSAKQGEGVGTCTTGGAWRNPKGNLSGQVPHDKCKTVTDPVEVTVTFSEPATYVLATSGNIQLNFVPTAEGTARGVQYKKSGNTTLGSGALVDETGEWTLDLSSIDRTGNGEMRARSISGLTACRTGTTVCSTPNGTLSW